MESKSAYITHRVMEGSIKVRTYITQRVMESKSAYITQRVMEGSIKVRAYITQRNGMCHESKSLYYAE